MAFPGKCVSTSASKDSLVDIVKLPSDIFSRLWLFCSFDRILEILDVSLLFSMDSQYLALSPSGLI